ncbi:MAG: acylneuraminate cytidylyltransferase family protein [Flavobacteriaceae bacterium]|nr:acylneuraminate cytidylyltransferase family protein [Flavobacteriaceae bacterium]
MRTLVVIPARGGSKGVPRKNIKLLGGKPLIEYSISVAREIFKDEDICVSTDDKEIKEIVESLGLKVPFLRPDSLATDKSGSYEMLLHALNFYESKGVKYDNILLLQPTSPLRKSEQVKEAILSYKSGLDMVVSVKETKSNPYYNLYEEDKNGYLSISKKGDFTRRQDCPKVWEYNGAIYIINIDSLKKMSLGEFTKVKHYEMDEITSMDIDTPLDWEVVKGLIK